MAARGPSTRPARVARLAWTALAALLCAAMPVAAHSDLASSTPRDGEQLPDAPAEVILRFTGAIEPSASSVRVVDGNGTRVDRNDLRTVGTTAEPVLVLGMRDGLRDGAYLVRWSVLSEDGHPNSGRIAFAVGNATAGPAASASELPTPGAVAGRVLSFAGLALGLGGAAWLWLVRAPVDGMGRAAGRALAAGGLLIAAGASALFWSTQAAAGVSAAVLAGSATGRLLLVRVACGAGAHLLAWLALRRPAAAWRWAMPGAALLVVAAGAATSAVGHAASHGLPGLLADAMHLLPSATWAGGVALLVVALGLAQRRGLPPEDVRRIGLRFGTVALACVVLLVLAGLATSLVILGRTALTDPLHLTGSLYGRLLLAKVGLALAMVAVAAANRFVFLAPAGTRGLRGRLAGLGPDGTTRGFRRTVAVEAAVGLAVLLVAGVLTAVSPGDHASHADHDEHVAANSPQEAPAPAAVAGVALISPWPDGRAMASFGLLHHTGTESGIDWVDITLGIVVLLVLAGIGYALYKLVQRRRGED